MKEKWLIRGEAVFTERGLVEAEFELDEGKIRWRGREGEPVEAFLVIPPFADTHIHGGWGFYFDSPESYLELEDRLARRGILFALPTLMNSSWEELGSLTEAFRKYRQEGRGLFPFLRIEGPFINPEKAGFQKKELMKVPEQEAVRRFVELAPYLKVFTFAPELKNSTLLVEEAVRAGMIPSAGHSNATFRQFMEVYRLGVRHMTHLANAMRGLHHREVGLLGAGLLLEDVFVEVIGDGVHTSYEFIKLVARSKGEDMVALVSDAIPPAGLERGVFDGRQVELRGGVYRTAEGTIAGGAKMVDQQFRELCREKVLPLELAVRWACVNPVRFFTGKEPVLGDGQEATFIMLDEELNLKGVFFKGRPLFLT